VATEFISEPISPEPGTADAAAMARGVPGLPAAFTWRDRRYVVQQLLESWKRSEAYNHMPGGERYYRRQYYRVLVDSGDIMTIYAVRHLKSGESNSQRWRLYTVEPGEPDS